MSEKLISFIRDVYATDDFIPLHAPRFDGNEKLYVLDTLESTFVSSVGKYVSRFESDIQSFTGCERAVATVNGTAALHIALHASGVERGDLVITQALTFVATCNAIRYAAADPIFIDVSMESLGLCPASLQAFLTENAFIDDEGICRHVQSMRRIKAVVPMHTFGHPVHLHELLAICDQWRLTLIEDAAESLGSYYKDKHTGTLGQFAALSFNGNKIITTGGGGMVMCKRREDGERIKHLTTTAKIGHAYEYVHDEVGFNYRLPNINSALGCAQMEVIDSFLRAKRALANAYKEELAGSDFQFVTEPSYAKSNYWLNSILCADENSRDKTLELTNAMGVMTRPVWRLMHRLSMYQGCIRGDLKTSEWLEARLINIPSSPPLSLLGDYKLSQI